MRARGVIPTLTAGLRDDWKSENEINEITKEYKTNKHNLSLVVMGDKELLASVFQ